ncbi:MAG: hypothetical protein N2258_01030 [Brevinematales bacterium]|nr:hypothetical protein [Brevinematales bacterium]
MKYLWVILFNVLGAYILILFLIGKGGIIENINKTDKITSLKKQKISIQIDIEDLKNRIETLKKLKNEENHILLEQGKKKDNTVIFKFIEKKINPSQEIKINNDFSFTIYILFAMVITIIVLGNLLIIMQYRRVRE